MAESLGIRKHGVAANVDLSLSPALALEPRHMAGNGIHWLEEENNELPPGDPGDPGKFFKS